MSEETTTSIKHWDEFKNTITGYINLPGKRRDQLIFRGQSNSSWGLLSSLDRQLQSNITLKGRNREEVRISLLDAFKREILGLNVSADITEPIEWECYARHHGLPTRILDWTSSPYIAAFFALTGDLKLMGDSVAIWILDRAAFEESHVPVNTTDSRSTLLSEYIEIYDDLDLLRINPRAIEQKALFMVVKDAKIAIERRLFKYLSRILISAEDRELALADLYEMNISARNLYRDPESATTTAVWRVMKDSI